MISTFNEFQYMIHETILDIMTLSKTWPKNEKHLLEYVNLSSYKFSYRNRHKRRDRGARSKRRIRIKVQD